MKTVHREENNMMCASSAAAFPCSAWMLNLPAYGDRILLAWSGKGGAAPDVLRSRGKGMCQVAKNS